MRCVVIKCNGCVLTLVVYLYGLTFFKPGHNGTNLRTNNYYCIMKY